MKKFFYVSVVFMAFGLTACSFEGSSLDNSEQTTDVVTTESVEQTTNLESTTVETEDVNRFEIEQNVEQFVKEVLYIDAQISSEEREFQVVTNDMINPTWMWSMIDISQNDCMDNYAAYWEVYVPEEAYVIWEMENGHYAVSEQYSGDLEYWDYTGKYSYLYTGRCEESAAYCYTSCQNTYWSEKYINISRAWVLLDNQLYLAVENYES